jgi:hypothetical protein
MLQVCPDPLTPKLPVLKEIHKTQKPTKIIVIKNENKIRYDNPLAPWLARCSNKSTEKRPCETWIFFGTNLNAQMVMESFSNPITNAQCCIIPRHYYDNILDVAGLHKLQHIGKQHSIPNAFGTSFNTSG